MYPDPCRPSDRHLNWDILRRNAEWEKRQEARREMRSMPFNKEQWKVRPNKMSRPSDEDWFMEEESNSMPYDDAGFDGTQSPTCPGARSDRDQGLQISG